MADRSRPRAYLAALDTRLAFLGQTLRPPPLPLRPFVLLRPPCAHLQPPPRPASRLQRRDQELLHSLEAGILSPLRRSYPRPLPLQNPPGRHRRTSVTPA